MALSCRCPPLPSPFLQVTTVTTPKVPGGPGEQSFCPSDQLGKETKPPQHSQLAVGLGQVPVQQEGFLVSCCKFLLTCPSHLPLPLPVGCLARGSAQTSPAWRRRQKGFLHAGLGRGRGSYSALQALGKASCVLHFKWAPATTVGKCRISAESDSVPL